MYLGCYECQQLSKFVKKVSWKLASSVWIVNAASRCYLFVITFQGLGLLQCFVFCGLYCGLDTTPQEAVLEISIFCFNCKCCKRMLCVCSNPSRLRAGVFCGLYCGLDTSPQQCFVAETQQAAHEQMNPVHVFLFRLLTAQGIAAFLRVNRGDRSYARFLFCFIVVLQVVRVFVCVCMCACACMCLCVHAWVHVCACVFVYMCTCLSVVDWISPLSILFISSLSIVQCEVGEFMPCGVCEYVCVCMSVKQKLKVQVLWYIHWIIWCCFSSPCLKLNSVQNFTLTSTLDRRL